jgi:tRNA dimethylallyltransferase
MLTPIAITGPTAAGKSAAAMAVARALAGRGIGVEIISVDSALVYRGMDIGSAKPTAADRAEVPHHLIDLIDPTLSYSAAQFVVDAQALIEDIGARGRLPLLVGGTMMYFKSLRDGIDAMPAADAEVRSTIEARAAQQGWPALHAELALVDPASAARLAPLDSQRIQRALEVWQLSGRPLSTFHRTGRADIEGSKPAVAKMSLISLEPASRAWLHQQIALRFDAMLAAGFVDEVRALKARPDLHAGLPSMRCVGYRQAWAALEAGDLSPLREQGIAATRQLAKRQLTWLRSMHDRQIVVADAESREQRVVELAIRALHHGI